MLATIIRWCSFVSTTKTAIPTYLRHAHVVKGDSVNGHFVPPGKVLLDACQEGMREVEARDPEDRWGALLNPLAEHGKALYEVRDVAAEGLHARIGLGHPQ